MVKKKLPVYSICGINPDVINEGDLMIAPLARYLQEREYLMHAHGHSFYHLVFFTKGAGEQYIDFNRFAVRPGQIYFMTPGQVHNWQFREEADGYIVNFSDLFFSPLVPDEQYLEKFPFFAGEGAEQVIQLGDEVRQQVTNLFIQLLDENKVPGLHAMDMKRVLLLQIFIIVSRQQESVIPVQAARPASVTLRKFRHLVNEHFMELRMPGEYATLLHITPNYLNAVCKDLLNVPAGEVIRARITLEAKRLLINAGMTITEISNALNFQDNSYFTRFFKNNTGKTPEQFRRDELPIS